MPTGSKIVVSGGAGLVSVAEVEELRALHEKARCEADASRERATAAVGIAIEIGKRLTDIKAALPHGKFLLWLEAHEKVLGFARTTAWKYMQLSNVHHGEHLGGGGLRAAYLKLGIVPAKRRPGDELRRVVANKAAVHLKWINDIGKWIRRAQRRDAKPAEFVCLRQLHMQLNELFNKGRRG